MKLSGELFAGRRNGIDLQHVAVLAEQIREIHSAGVEVGVVVGGGNIFRGREASAMGMDRPTADYIGMLGTVQNALALQNSLERMGTMTRLMTAIEMPQVAEPFISRRAARHLEKGRVVLFAAGLGSPFFSTDTAAALRAVQIKADVLLKATNVDGVYDRDPRKHKKAVLLRQVDFNEALQRGLKVMDATAFSLNMENNIPVILFNAKDDPTTIKRVALGEKLGSLVGRLNNAKSSSR